MWIMVVYVLIVVVSELIVVGIGLALDRIAPIASLPVSLTLFFAVLWFGWLLAVRWTNQSTAKNQNLRPKTRRRWTGDGLILSALQQLHSAINRRDETIIYFR